MPDQKPPNPNHSHRWDNLYNRAIATLLITVGILWHALNASSERERKSEVGRREDQMALTKGIIKFNDQQQEFLKEQEKTIRINDSLLLELARRDKQPKPDQR